MPLLGQFVLAHAAVAGCWLALIGMLVGIGLWFRQVFVRGPLAAEDPFFCMWTGYACTLAFLQLWHFALPIDGRTLTIALLVGWSGLVVHRRALSAWLRGAAVRLKSWHALFACVFVVWMANAAIGPVSNFDGGAYHIPTIEWTNAFRIVPGLGNLHGRLAFNSSSLLFAAMVDVGPLNGRAFHVVGGVLLLPFALHALGAFRRLTRGEPTAVAGDAYAASLIVLVAFATLARESSSLDTDIPVALAFLVAAELLVRQYDAPALADDRSRWQLATFVLMTSSAVAMKLSAAVLGLSMLLLAAWIFRGVIRAFGRRVGATVVVPVVLVGSWICRGVILSGYPLYPSSLLPVPVSWRVPAEQAASEAAWVTFSARVLNQHDIPQHGHWMREWLKGLGAGPQDALMLALPILLTLVAATGAIIARRRLRRVAPDQWLLFVPSLLALAFWFLVAPHPRFAQGALWVIAGFATALAFAARFGVDDTARAASARRVATGLVTSIGGLLLVQAVFSPLGLERVGWIARATTLGGLVTTPGPDHGLHPMGSSRRLMYTTNSGLKVTVPVLNNLCWQEAIVCTPHPSPYLNRVSWERALLRTAGSGNPCDGQTPSRRSFRIGVVWRLRNEKA
ncbi:MAG: hypothetical protein U0163_04170 [Gemmatimonadaceae bacterium]